jgi:hypothetical protein
MNSDIIHENWITFHFSCLAYVMQRRNSSHGIFWNCMNMKAKGGGAL